MATCVTTVMAAAEGAMAGMVEPVTRCDSCRPVCRHAKPLPGMRTLTSVQPLQHVQHTLRPNALRAGCLAGWLRP